MIDINGVKFAKNNSDFIDSLFSKKTCYGFYKKLKNKIIFQDHQKVAFLALVKNKNGVFLVNCSKKGSGYFYQYSMSDNYRKLLGVPKSFSQERYFIDKLGVELL